MLCDVLVLGSSRRGPQRGAFVSVWYAGLLSPYLSCEHSDNACSLLTRQGGNKTQLHFRSTFGKVRVSFYQKGLAIPQVRSGHGGMLVVKWTEPVHVVCNVKQ